MTRTRSGLNSASAAPMSPGAISTLLSPVSPVSMERRPFCRDSGKLRPMAMASPTDFIDVVSRGSAPGNFSKVKRGILVTT